MTILYAIDGSKADDGTGWYGHLLVWHWRTTYNGITPPPIPYLGDTTESMHNTPRPIGYPCLCEVSITRSSILTHSERVKNQEPSYISDTASTTTIKEYPCGSELKNEPRYLLNVGHRQTEQHVPFAAVVYGLLDGNNGQEYSGCCRSVCSISFEPELKPKSHNRWVTCMAIRADENDGFYASMKPRRILNTVEKHKPHNKESAVYVEYHLIHDPPPPLPDCKQGVVHTFKCRE
ncbi:predicted protein [Postia placenta Mad-698-R]|uniref:Uncharacterized protein n=1 Tax=Postia placenta MAD-698-R-SB12 TaxID=670580 RepID=A0A1X6MX44_9APHY|nr:hypothetical protein POSPLADRAFT_1145720 [Postia placenta MAD-698-R-SB12]EED77131.1 predicted protein [Postia placenta Mad-698-R]OSX60945.1 hypothetical protein POSPLADRAFT_1145720 [Postia placenta MAD-698-R-SB12]